MNRTVHAMAPAAERAAEAEAPKPRVLFLASGHPRFGHAIAHHTVLAHLMIESARLGYAVAYATCGAANEVDGETARALEAEGVRHAGDFTAHMTLTETASAASKLRALRRAFLPSDADDFPRFDAPRRAAEALEAIGADRYVLFQDTFFELLIPHLDPGKIVAYWARPRHGAPMARWRDADAEFRGMGTAKRWIVGRLLAHQRARYFDRARRLVEATNICQVDVEDLRRHGVACRYVPNCWPDAFGADWETRREAAERAEGRFRILGNTGDLGATGNTYGLEYLATHVLPRLDDALAGIDWEISLCGGGTLPPDLAARLDHPRVKVLGFVPDIDAEVVSHPVFLLLNNAGPHTGGYTRVAYGFSAGTCLIAHRRLAESMPEVRHEENAMLGEAGADFAAFVRRAATDPAWRRRIGRTARATYERMHRPAAVAEALLRPAPEGGGR